LVSCCDWGDQEIVRATESELGAEALSPAALNGLTEEQLRTRDEWNRIHLGFDWRPRPCSTEAPLDWVAVNGAYGGPPKYAPADFILSGRRKAGDEAAMAVADSNGCAAGDSWEGAKLSAILELIERDAIGRWWYSGASRAPLDAGSIEGIDQLTNW